MAFDPYGVWNYDTIWQVSRGSILTKKTTNGNSQIFLKIRFLPRLKPQLNSYSGVRFDF